MLYTKFQRLFPITYPIANSPTSSMNDNIRFVFSGQAFGLSNGRALFAMFAGYSFVAFTPNGPAVIMGHHMLMPSPPTFSALGTVQEYLD